MEITQDLVRTLFDYDPTTGVVTHRTNKHKAKAGSRAGSTSKTHSRYLRVHGKKELEHRLIWLYMTGCFPTGEVDHKDHNRGNNKWLNLRDVTHAENMRNKPRYCSNTTGITGVSIDKRCGKYRAYLSVNGKPKGLGYFPTLAEAIAARNAAMVQSGAYHANHGN